jgi:hypothetical protein
MNHLKFIFDISTEDALTSYALLSRLVKKVEPFFTNGKELLSLEVKIYTNEKDITEKIAVFTVVTAQGKLIESGKGFRVEDALANAFDRISESLNNLVSESTGGK